MLFDKRHQRKEESVDFTSDKLSVFPLATPLLAGPAAITSVIVSVSATGNDFTKQAIGMLALIAATLVTFIILFIAAKSEKIINKRIISIFSRIVAIVLAGLSIQYILDGIYTEINFGKLIDTNKNKVIIQNENVSFLDSLNKYIDKLILENKYKFKPL